jgi:hypothetical protein
MLAGNLKPVEDATTAVLRVMATDVTIDLGGYSISNAGASSAECGGIAIFADRVAVRNGSISGFVHDRQYGVVVAPGVRGYVVENMRIGDCKTGIGVNPGDIDAALPRTGRIENCSITDCAAGVVALSCAGLTIRNCAVSGCLGLEDSPGGGGGIVLRGIGFVVAGCSFIDNAVGMAVEAETCRLSDSVFSANRREGGVIGGTALHTTMCSFSGNGGAGLVCTAGGAILNSVFSGNGRAGLELDKGAGITPHYALISGCSFLSNAEDGLLHKGGGKLTADGCLAAGNRGSGLKLQPGDSDRNCLLEDNGAPGNGGVLR